MVEQENTVKLPKEELPLMPTRVDGLGFRIPTIMQCNNCGECITSTQLSKRTDTSVIWTCVHCHAATETLNWKETVRIIQERKLSTRFSKWIKSIFTFVKEN